MNIKNHEYVCMEIYELKYACCTIREYFYLSTLLKNYWENSLYQHHQYQYR